VLIIFGGLPGTRKTTLARELARQIGAMHLRIDSIEQAIRACAHIPALDHAGYRVDYANARDNLRIGRTVIAASVNRLGITRDAWLEVGRRAQANTIEIGGYML
jgi:predicted kinase